MMAFIILMKLGFWQLHRAHHKQEILTQHHRMHANKAIKWSSNSQAPQAFQAIMVEGVPLNVWFYLDNQFYQHQIGFDLILPVLQENGSIILVDYGWVKANPNRAELPNVEVLPQKKWLGTVYYPSQSSVALGKMLDHQQGNRYVIESYDFVEMQKILGHSVHNWVLRLKLEQNTTFKREWPVVNLLPERHKAYALQWFTMALVVGIILLWRIIKYAKQSI